MLKQVELTPGIENLVFLHQERARTPEYLLPFFDWYIGERVGLFAHSTYSGAVFYKSPQRYKHLKKRRTV